MSAIVNTKRALERLLKQTFPTTAIAYENVSFTPPDSVAYLRTQFTIQSPDDPTIGDNYYRERITFQVFVVSPSNKGTTTALQMAEQIRTAFSKGKTFNESGTSIYVLNTPQIAGASVPKDSVVIPVIIQVVAEVFE